MSPLSDTEMEPMSSELPFVEIMPPLVIPIIELSSTTTPVSIAASPPIPEYHPAASPAYEEDPSEETSTATSRIPNDVGSSRVHRVEVLSKHPRIIHTPFVPERRGARRRNCSRS